MTTKEKIINTATKIFNERGYGAVNLKELAQEIGISRGNLTYHFKSKEAILAGIVEEMWVKIDEAKQKTRQVPSFENMHNQTQLYYSFQQAYAFIFLDTNVRNHPAVKEQFQAMIEQSLEDFPKMGLLINMISSELIANKQVSADDFKTCVRLEKPVAGKVRICVMQAATGLEAPVVFLLGLHRMFDQERKISLNEDEKKEMVEENTNLLYMGMTRASQKLVLSFVGPIPESVQQAVNRVNEPDESEEGLLF